MEFDWADYQLLLEKSTASFYFAALQQECDERRDVQK